MQNFKSGENLHSKFDQLNDSWIVSELQLCVRHFANLAEKKYNKNAVVIEVGGKIL